MASGSEESAGWVMVMTMPLRKGLLVVEAGTYETALRCATLGRIDVEIKTS